MQSEWQDEQLVAIRRIWTDLARNNSGVRRVGLNRSQGRSTVVAVKVLSFLPAILASKVPVCTRTPSGEELLESTGVEAEVEAETSLVLATLPSDDDDVSISLLLEVFSSFCSSFVSSFFGASSLMKADHAALLALVEKAVRDAALIVLLDLEEDR